MQKFRTLAAFFLVEKQQPRRKEKIMPSTMVTTSSAQRRSDQNYEKDYSFFLFRIRLDIDKLFFSGLGIQVASISEDAARIYS